MILKRKKREWFNSKLLFKSFQKLKTKLIRKILSTTFNPTEVKGIKSLIKSLKRQLRKKKMTTPKIKRLSLYTIKKKMKSFWCITGTVTKKRALMISLIARVCSTRDSSSVTTKFCGAKIKKIIQNAHKRILTCFNGSNKHWSKNLTKK